MFIDFNSSYSAIDFHSTCKKHLKNISEICKHSNFIYHINKHYDPSKTAIWYPKIIKKSVTFPVGSHLFFSVNTLQWLSGCKKCKSTGNEKKKLTTFKCNSNICFFWFRDAKVIVSLYLMHLLEELFEPI